MPAQAVFTLVVAVVGMLCMLVPLVWLLGSMLLHSQLWAALQNRRRAGHGHELHDLVTAKSMEDVLREQRARNGERERAA